MDAALAAIRQEFAGTIRAGIILGTGLGQLADHIQADAYVDYHDIPGFPRSTALSHKGRLVLGSLGGVPIAAMQGRCHLYEGYPADELAFPVHVLAELGAELLIVSNASGGVNPLFEAGDLVVMEDHINLMWNVQHESSGSKGLAGRGAYPGARPYSPELIELALRVAREHDFTLHPGTYVAVSGPNYETRAEYRLFRQIGGDVVGMSTVPEVTAAAHRGLQTLALSMVTNVARPDAPVQVDAEDVVAVAEGCEPHMRQIVMQTLTSLYSSTNES